MIVAPHSTLQVAADAVSTMPLRLWLRRRRLLLASAALTVVVVPFLLFMANVTGTYVIGPADYDVYDYDAVDGVRALVHQMSHSSKTRRDVIGIRFQHSPSRHVRTQTAHHTYDGGDDDNNGLLQHDIGGYTGRAASYPRSNNAKSRRIGGSRKGIFRRKIQDSEDVPHVEIKGYAFLHQRTAPKSKLGGTRISSPKEQTQVDVIKPDEKVEEPNDAEMYHASEDEDDYGVGDEEENPKEAMFEPRPGDEEDKEDDQEYLEADETPYDYWSRNPEFKRNDFDPLPSNHSKPQTVLKYEDINHQAEDSGTRRHVDSLVRSHNNGAHNNNGPNVGLERTSRLRPQGGRQLVVERRKSRLAENNNGNTYNNNQQRGSDNNMRFMPNCDQTVTGCRRAALGDRTLNNGTMMAHRRSGGHNPQNTRQTYLKQKYHTAVALNRSRPEVVYAHHLPLHEQPATQLQLPELPPQRGDVVSRTGFKVVTNSIYWSRQVERFVSPGFTADDVATFRQKVGHLKVAEMREPQWNRCGRPKNQYVILEDGSALCARYRSPHTKMIQGEILSFNLARLLGVDSVPVSVLAEVNSSAPQWSRVEPTRAGWEDGQVVVFIQWIEGLDQIWSQVKMPSLILSAYQQGIPVDRNHPALPTMSASELGELLQWSDMILFDYIIGHYDRVASMQDGAEREQKASIMSESIRNLRKVPATNKLWFVDNESGLFDGYELMKYGRKNGPRFVHFHEQMLQTVCLFRRSLVQNIEALASSSDPQDILTRFTAVHEPLYNKLPSVTKVKYFKQFFHTRLKEVVNWVAKCRGS